MTSSGPGTPPPFSKDRMARGRSGDRSGYGSARRDDRGYDRDGVGGTGSGDWAEDYLGKPRDMSWSAYLGLGDFAARRGPRDGYQDGRDGAGPAEAGMKDAAMGRVDPYYRSPNPNRLFRNKQDGKLCGVCAGIADYLNVDTALVRIGFIAGLFLFTPVFLVGYVILCLILKPRPTQLFETPEEEKFWRSVTTKPDQTLAGLRTKFRTLERELSSMEGYVASPEFSLNRQFKDLEKR